MTDIAADAAISSSWFIFTPYFSFPTFQEPERLHQAFHAQVSPFHADMTPMSTRHNISIITRLVLSRWVTLVQSQPNSRRALFFMVRLRVKEIAKEKGISMGKLSRAADISYRTIQRIYNEPKYIPTIPTLERIAKVLKVPIGDLLAEDPD